MPPRHLVPALAALLLLACGGRQPPASEAPASAAPASAAPPFVPDALLSEPRYRTGQIWPQYVGEEVAGGHYPTAVRYLDAEARAAYRVFVREGRLVDAGGRPLNAGAPPAAEGGVAIYVMDEAGNLYASFEQEKGIFHHSTFLAGGPVAAAGELQVFDGRPVWISNTSGHYRPPPFTLDAVFERLAEMGLDVSAVERRAVGTDAGN